MKLLASLILWAATLGVAPAESIRQVVLDPSKLVRIPVARDRLTVVRFPDAISDLEGAYLSPEPEPPALFQISFRPGNAFFSLRALVTNATAAVMVGWHGQSYMLECVESSDPLLSVVLTPPGRLPVRPPIGARPTPARLQSLLNLARLYESVGRQHPELLAHVERLAPLQHMVFPDCEMVLDEVFRFDSEDALAFHATLHNRTVEPIVCRSETLAVRVGERVFFQALAEGDVIVPPCGQATVFFVIAAGIKGTPPGISIRNDFAITFERVGPVSAARCASPQAPKSIVPYRSPKHESQLPSH